MGILIKGGSIVTEEKVYKGDVYIENETISSIGENLPVADGTQEIDATDLYVMPGGIDVHTHFDLPMFNTVSSDDHYTGHKAAAFGGTTTVIDFVSQDKEELVACVEAWHEKAGDKAAIDYGFHMNISQFDDSIAKQIPGLRKLGINSVKVFTAYNDRLRLNDAYIFKVMRIAKDNGMLVLVHAENGDVIDVLVNEALAAGNLSPIWHARTRPTSGAEEAVYRTIKLAQMAQSPVYIVHMNTKGGAKHLHEARMMGLPVMGETCPQYLFFTENELKREDGSKWVCSPPMRLEMDAQALWTAIENGDMQTIATDHCPFFYDGTKPVEYEGEMIAIPGKELGKNDFTKIPNGLPGVGDRMAVLWTHGVGENRISPPRFVQLMATNPAKIFGLYPRKGSVQVGSDADLVIWDPDKEIVYGTNYAQHRTDHNLYEGMQLRGFVDKVFLRGKLIVNGKEWLGSRGGGEFIAREKAQVI